MSSNLKPFIQLNFHSKATNFPQLTVNDLIPFGHIIIPDTFQTNNNKSPKYLTANHTELEEREQRKFYYFFIITYSNNLNIEFCREWTKKTEKNEIPFYSNHFNSTLPRKEGLTTRKDFSTYPYGNFCGNANDT